MWYQSLRICYLSSFDNAHHPYLLDIWFGSCCGYAPQWKDKWNITTAYFLKTISLPLIWSNISIPSLCTVLELFNSLANPRLSTDKHLKRFFSFIYRRWYVIRIWYKSKVPSVDGWYFGDRWQKRDRTKQEYIQVTRPEAIGRYNQIMGLSLYRSYVGSKKWIVRMITHPIHLALLYSKPVSTFWSK